MLVHEQTRADQVAQSVVLLVEGEDAGRGDTGVDLDFDFFLPRPENERLKSKKYVSYHAETKT